MLDVVVAEDAIENNCCCYYWRTAWLFRDVETVLWPLLQHAQILFGTPWPRGSFGPAWWTVRYGCWSGEIITSNDSVAGCRISLSWLYWCWNRRCHCCCGMQLQLPAGMVATTSWNVHCCCSRSNLAKMQGCRDDGFHPCCCCKIPEALWVSWLFHASAIDEIHGALSTLILLPYRLPCPPNFFTRFVCFCVCMGRGCDFIFVFSQCVCGVCGGVRVMIVLLLSLLFCSCSFLFLCLATFCLLFIFSPL